MVPRALQPLVGAAAPRVLGEGRNGLVVTPRSDPFFGPAGNLEAQLNAPSIPPLLSFEEGAVPASEATWYDYDSLLEQFRLSERLPISWAGGAFGTLFYDLNRQQVVEGAGIEGGGFNSLAGGSVLMGFGEPGARLRFDLSYAVFLVSSWGEELLEAVNQNFGFSASYQAAKTAINFGLMAGQQPYNSLDLGGNVERINLMASAGLSHQLRPKWSVGATASSLSNLYEEDVAQSSSQNFVGGFVDYQVRSKLTTGLQYNFGLVEFSGRSAGQFSHQLLTRLSWDLGEKLSLSGSFGVDRTSIEEFANLSSIWQITAAYRLGNKSSVTLNGFRRTMPSVAFENQFFYMTGVMVGVGTQLSDRLAFGLSGGVQSQNYVSGEAREWVDREDLLVNYGLNLNYRLGTRTQLSLFYQKFSNASTGEGARSLDGGQLGLSVSMRF